MSDRPTRRALMRPVQLLGIAFACAVFAGLVTFFSAGGFQTGGGTSVLPLALVVAGVTFIGVLLGLSLLLLAVDPAQVERPVDRPVLLPDEPADDSGDGDAAASPRAQ
ncbi:amino acid transporter [Microbacterium sp. NPDC078428]|uniref:amino acid transporter n=1 Tax=Microbacterium sp. NPDC078428 TaxID=3364190 RepID=UPI0037CA227A